MNLKDLATELAVEVDRPIGEVHEMLKILITKIKAHVKEGESINIKGFGSFILKETQDREGINYLTKKKQIFKGRKSLRFKASKKALEIDV